MSQSSVSSSSHNRHERHLMRQRGAGPRNITATFGFAFDFPTPPETSSKSALTERPTKRRKTVISSEDDATEHSEVRSLPSDAGNVAITVDAATTKRLLDRNGTAAVPATDDAPGHADVPTASTVATEVFAVLETRTKSSRVKRKARVPPSARDFSASPAARGVGDDSFIALLRPKRTRVIETTANATTVLETVVMPNAAEVKRSVTSRARDKPLKKPSATRKAKSKTVKSACITVTLAVNDASPKHSPGHETAAQPASNPTEGSIPPQITLDETAAPPTTNAKPIKKTPARKNGKCSKRAPARKKAGAHPAKRDDAAGPTQTAARQSSTANMTTDVPTETGGNRVRTLDAANGSHPHARTRMPFSYAEEPDDPNVDILPKEKARKRAPAKKSGNDAITAAGSRRKRAAPELLDESCDGDGEHKVNRSPEPPEPFAKRRRPLQETHANTVRQPAASQGTLDFEFALKPKRSQKKAIVDVPGDADVVSKSRRPLVRQSLLSPDSNPVDLEDVDWLSAPIEPQRQPPQSGALSTRSKAPQKWRKLADVPDTDLDDLVMNIGSLVKR
ncbi:hypothetical protein LTR91_014760 [Friedmanniomyces endolithicus]|uniref:Uncharacterized protein n=1 Tax=Friedmanniomyces endolithicus TaxID=329885 RepID=A0AAN6KB34_9PEZI|nr:hypothetical protein LTR94_006307 [Friedmanniomyces endolithicus]KAK0804131.1 hypothetical protein LTR38_005915 [Friedmanniomyces endolithicus]KAK0811056.1 hypothetical protein LTR59_002067 [Friedmanniomyces endolithicus]KAK0815295.1 hypothetical protein LTR75_003964 [Friedmanniomyces endolithicus]KAK0853015.1 hypothetical protein LTR03_003162 [Friedmanniomyces endolithicus]